MNNFNTQYILFVCWRLSYGCVFQHVSILILATTTTIKKKNDLIVSNDRDANELKSFLDCLLLLYREEKQKNSSSV